jgi:hypothetical protein
MPKWREVIASGGNATTNMDAVWDSMEIPPPLPEFKIRLDDPTGPYWAEHYMRGDIGLVNDARFIQHVDPKYSATEADNIARAKFFKYLQALRQSFQGLTFLGELKETLHMLRRPAAALWDKNLGYLSALSKAKRRDPRNFLRTAGGLWLEQAFGWTPLLNDCKDAYQAYEKLVKPNEEITQYLKAKGKFSKDRTGDGTLVGLLGQGAVYYAQQSRWLENVNVSLAEEHQVRYIGAVRSKVKATQWDNMELFGFTAENFIPTAWELLPWSFLVDYFTNIGDILSCAITHTNDVKFVNKTTIRTTVLNYSVKVVPGLKPAPFSGASWKITYEECPSYTWSSRRRVINRQPNSGISLPTLQLSFDLRDKQLGNIAALLTQANALHKQRRRLP